MLSRSYVVVWRGYIVVAATEVAHDEVRTYQLIDFGRSVDLTLFVEEVEEE